MNRNERPSNIIPRILRRVFRLAAEGDELGAWIHWREAIDKGYVVNPKTELWLHRVIAKARHRMT